MTSVIDPSPDDLKIDPLRGRPVLFFGQFIRDNDLQDVLTHLSTRAQLDPPANSRLMSGS